mmetsp:Transcript_3403/g.8651  ORF Transcript_3403/g.8651 Transcript_3403/m.8651 type:complete len:201 (+) Transcript_3403:312-914(+)
MPNLPTVRRPRKQTSHHSTRGLAQSHHSQVPLYRSSVFAYPQDCKLPTAPISQDQTSRPPLPTFPSPLPVESSPPAPGSPADNPISRHTARSPFCKAAPDRCECRSHPRRPWGFGRKCARIRDLGRRIFPVRRLPVLFFASACRTLRSTLGRLTGRQTNLFFSRCQRSEGEGGGCIAVTVERPTRRKFRLVEMLQRGRSW